MKRFWSKVHKTNKCWIWQAATRSMGRYGTFYYNGKNIAAHRASWLLNVGPIPKKLDVLHTCDIGLCVNPEHLFLGTHLQNMQDRNTKGRASGGKLQGITNPNHKLTPSEIIAMRMLYAKNIAIAEIARLYNTSEMNAHKIVKLHTWKHVV